MMCTDDVRAVELRALCGCGASEAEGSDTAHVSRERVAARRAGQYPAASPAQRAALRQSRREELASAVPHRPQDLRGSLDRRFTVTGTFYVVRTQQGSKNPAFLKKSPTQWVFWGFIGFWVLSGFIGFFGQAGKIGKMIQKLSNVKP